MTKIIESKVAVAAAGGGVGGVLASFLLWLLGVTVWHVSAAAGSADLAIAAVPAPVSGVLLTLLPAALSLLGGYLAPHTARPDLSTPLTVALAEAEPTVVTSTAATPIVTASTAATPTLVSSTPAAPADGPVIAPVP